MALFFRSKLEAFWIFTLWILTVLKLLQIGYLTNKLNVCSVSVYQVVSMSVIWFLFDLFRSWRWDWICSRLALTMVFWHVPDLFTDKSLRCLFTGDSCQASSAWSPMQVWSVQFTRWDAATLRYQMLILERLTLTVFRFTVNHELGKKWSGLQQRCQTVFLQFCGLRFWSNHQLPIGSDKDSAASTR